MLSTEPRRLCLSFSPSGNGVNWGGKRNTNKNKIRQKKKQAGGGVKFTDVSSKDHSLDPDSINPILT